MHGPSETLRPAAAPDAPRGPAPAPPFSFLVALLRALAAWAT